MSRSCGSVVSWQGTSGSIQSAFDKTLYYGAHFTSLCVPDGMYKKLVVGQLVEFDAFQNEARNVTAPGGALLPGGPNGKYVSPESHKSGSVVSWEGTRGMIQADDGTLFHVFFRSLCVPEGMYKKVDVGQPVEFDAIQGEARNVTAPGGAFLPADGNVGGYGGRGGFGGRGEGRGRDFSSGRGGYQRREAPPSTEIGQGKGSVHSFRQGWGFINDTEGNRHFVHFRDLCVEEGANRGLCEGQEVEFTIVQQADGRTMATKVCAPGGGNLPSQRD